MRELRKALCDQRRRPVIEREEIRSGDFLLVSVLSRILGRMPEL